MKVKEIMDSYEVSYGTIYLCATECSYIVFCSNDPIYIGKDMEQHNYAIFEFVFEDNAWISARDKFYSGMVEDGDDPLYI